MRNKPYIDKIRQKHPTLKGDIAAYASGSQNTFSNDYVEYMQSIETVDRIIRTIANIMSLAKLKTYKRDTKGDLKPATIKNINFELPNETDSEVDLWRKTAVNIWGQGAALLVTESGQRGGRELINFYTLNVARVAAESNGTKLISKFIYTAEDGSEIAYDAESCVYINDSIDPSNLLYSLSRLKSLNDVVNLQAGIVRQTSEKITGGAKDSHIISSSAPISERNMRVIKNAVDAFMTSATSSSLFLNTGVDVKAVGTSMTGTEMLSFFKEVNQMMISQFNIPAYILGDFHSSANKSEEVRYALRIFFTTQLKPVFRNIELQLTRFFQESLGLKNIVAKFDFSDMDFLDESIDEKTDRALKLNKQGIASMNEAREMAELAPLPQVAADNHYLPAFLTGAVPVSVEGYDIERAAFLSSIADASQTMPSGSSGGADNQNIITDSRGGPQE